MSYKTILVHADLSIHAPRRIRVAAALARAEGAHLVGAAMTDIARVTRLIVADAAADVNRTVPIGLTDILKENARQALDRFTLLAQEAGVASLEPRMLDDSPGDGLVQQSRFADLVVVSQTDPAHRVGGVAPDLPEYVLLHSPRPVLLVPFAGQYADNLDGNAVAAWDGSLEASRALAHGLPLLKRAREVTVAQFDSIELVAQAPPLAQWLARHGVQAKVHAHEGDIHEGDALLSLAARLQADLIVMGAYGHARMRELLLGGVTRTVLKSATVPVLMSH